MEGPNFGEKTTDSDIENSVKSKNRKNRGKREKDQREGSKDYEAEKAKIVGQIIARESQTRPLAEKKDEPKDSYKDLEITNDIGNEPKHGVKGKTSETVSETEAPEEELAESEKTDIYAELAQEAHQERLTNVEDSEYAPGLSEALDRFDQLVIEEGVLPKDAADTVLRERGINPENAPDDSDKLIEEPKNPIPAALPEANSVEWLDLSDDEEITLDHGAEEQLPQVGKETTLESEDKDPVVNTGGSGGNNPLRPTANLSGNGNLPPQYGQPNLLPDPNIFPPRASVPKVETPRQEYIEDRANPATLALVGGIVGYLIGRRRGRIKTEKKLLPIQKKLEKQVVDLQWDLKRQEIRVRKSFAKKTEKPKSNPKPELNKRIENLTTTTPLKPEKVKEFSPLFIEKPLSGERKKAPEAQSLHGEVRTQEHLGHVLVAASEVAVTADSSLKEEINQEVSVEKGTDSLDKPKMNKTYSERQVEIMSRSELLSISAKIDVDGSNLKQIYETHLIGEKGLRRLVTEHLSGGDLKKSLRNEIVEREIDFERDPVMRDMASSSSTSEKNKASSNGATLDQLIHKAESSLPANEELAFYKAKANYEVDQKQKQLQKRQVMDVGLLLSVAILIAVIVFLFMSRS
jgi:hypothetical protein